MKTAKYSQEDAELMLKIYKDMNRWRTGTVSKELRQLVENIDALRMKVHVKVFGEKSCWKIQKKDMAGWDVKVVYEDGKE